jgi:hypothetical protein
MRLDLFEVPSDSRHSKLHHYQRWIHKSGSDENVAQGSLFSLAAFPPRRDFDGAARMFSETVFGAGRSLKRIVLLAARQEPASLEGPLVHTASGEKKPSLPSQAFVASPSASSVTNSMCERWYVTRP